MSNNSSIMWLKPSLIALSSTLPAVYGNILKTRAGEVLTPEVSASIDAIRRNASIPGYSIALVKLGKETEFGNWGNMAEDGKLISEDTLIDIASCSKAFTVTAFGLLIDDFIHGRNATPLPNGLTKLTWDTKVKDLLPSDEWDLMDSWAEEKASVRDILSHVSGLPRHDYAYLRNDTIVDVAKRLQYLRPTYELRQQWQYNNIMYMIASHIISLYAGMPFSDYVEQRIFIPLNMSSSTYSPTKANATGHFTQFWTSLTEGPRRIPYWFGTDGAELIEGPGGIISSARELTHWVAALLDSNSTTFPREALEEPMNAQSIMSRGPSDSLGMIATYGLGWAQTNAGGTSLVLHTGGIPGVSTLVALIPDQQMGVVMLANTDSGETANLEVLTLLAQAALGNASSSTSISLDYAKRALGQSHRTSLPELPNSFSSTLHRRAENASQSTSTDLLAGTYVNDGYGAITLCAPLSTSDTCKDVFTAFGSLASANSTPEVLYGHFPRVWASHVRVRRQQGSTFLLDLTTPYPQGFGADTTPFEVLAGTVSIVFELSADEEGVVGFGLFGVNGDGVVPSLSNTTVENVADVWFKRV